MRWLAATSLPCADRASVAETRLFIETYASPKIHVHANVFDGHVSNCKALLTRAARDGSGAADGSSRLVALADTSAGAKNASAARHHTHFVTVTSVPGHKTIFWKRELTPAVISKFDIVWLFDCDVRVSPHLYSRANVEHWLEVTGASIVQPSVVAATIGGRAGRGALTRSVLSAECVAREVPYIEQMTPIFRRAAFFLLWRTLQQIPDARLGSDSGLEALWCGLAAMHMPDKPPCVLLHHQSIVHMNTHTIHRFDKGEKQNYFNASNNLYPYLKEHFASVLRAASRLNDTEEVPKGVSTRSSAAHDRWLSRAKWNSSGASTSKTSRGCWGL